MNGNGTALATNGNGESRPLSLVERTGARFGVDPNKLLATMKATCFKQPPAKNGPAVEVSNEQMMALLVVADQYGLNPFTKEIYAFADKGGIVPVVGVDGWIRLMNSHPEHDGLEFEYGETVTTKVARSKFDYDSKKQVPTEIGPFTGPEWVEAVITRKDRSRPIRVRETDPWRISTARMLRHRALIQCARIAYGFAGIHDEDDALTIVGSSQFDALPAAQRASTQADRIKNRLGVGAPRETLDVSAAPVEAPAPTRTASPVPTGYTPDAPPRSKRPSESEEPPDDVELPPLMDGEG